MTGQYSLEVEDVRAFGQDSDAETKETNLDFWSLRLSGNDVRHLRVGDISVSADRHTNIIRHEVLVSPWKKKIKAHQRAREKICVFVSQLDAES